MWDRVRMALQVSHKGAEYAHQIGKPLQYFQMSDQSEEAIYMSKMGKVQDDLHHIDFTSKKTWKDIITDVCHIKEYVV